MSNIGLSFDFKEVNSMLRNKSLSELKESLSYLLLNYAELIEDKNIHEFIADISTLTTLFDKPASNKPIATHRGTPKSKTYNPAYSLLGNTLRSIRPLLLTLRRITIRSLTR